MHERRRLALVTCTTGCLTCWADYRTPCCIDQVQKAMAAANERQSEWMNDDFMGRFSKNPRLMKGFSDPRCQKAMQEMQVRKMSQQGFAAS